MFHCCQCNFASLKSIVRATTSFRPKLDKLYHMPRLNEENYCEIQSSMDTSDKDGQPASMGNYSLVILAKTLGRDVMADSSRGEHITSQRPIGYVWRYCGCSR